MRTKARSVAVVAFDEVDLLDLTAPLEVLSAAGRRWNFRPYKVSVLAARAGLVSTRGQLRVEATSSLVAASPPDILLVPGGYGARRAAGDVEYREQVARLASSAELVAGIGLGVLLLAGAGVVGDARLAVTAELAGELGPLVAASQLEREEPLVAGQRFITARNSGNALALGLAIVRRTMGPKLVAMVAQDLGVETDETQAKLEIRY